MDSVLVVVSSAYNGQAGQNLTEGEVAAVKLVLAS